MASAVFFNAERSQQIEDTAIVSGLVDANGNLILKTRIGTEQNAGNVRGPKGSDAQYPLPNTSGVATYVRLATIDGGSVYQGGRFNFWLSGLGNYGTPRNATVLVHAQQRAADVIVVSAWAFDITAANAPIQLYTRKLGPFLFEIWYKAAPYQAAATLTTLSLWSTTLNIDSMSTTMPSDLSEVPIRIAESDMASSPSVQVTGNGAISTPFQLTVRGVDDQALKVGLLEHSYRGGPAKVRMDGVWSTEAYPWATPYVPHGSRSVRVLRVGSSWVIAGQTEDAVSIDLNYANYVLYGDYTNTSTWANRARAVKLPSGLVVLSGLLIGKGVPPVDTPIGWLPPGYRPDTVMMFATEYGDTSRVIRVMPSGLIMMLGSIALPSNAYVSLDGIAFWAAGVASWTPIGSGGSSWGANFEADGPWSVTYGAPAFYKDVYGTVWFRGLARVKVATSVDNTLIANLPETHRPFKEEHQRVGARDMFGLIGTKPDTGLLWKTGSPGAVGSWLSLCDVRIRTIESNSRILWVDKTYKSSGWGDYNVSSFPAGAYALREDGLRMLSGLINGGSIPSAAWVNPERELWPSNGRIIIPTASVGNRARLDLHGVNDYMGTPGSVLVSQGSTGWTSLDGRVWIT